jgi:hypothetical protein
MLQVHGPMRVIALIEDPGGIRRVLEHLELRAPEALERSPPLDFASWSPYASLPLTYHPVPDVA